MRASLGTTTRAPRPLNTAHTPPAALLAASGARVILGETALGVSVQPSRTTCFGPRGAHVFGQTSALWICDTGHHRLLGYKTLPSEDGAAADWVIGQPGFEAEGRNGKRPTTAASVNVPTGIAPYQRGFAVADAWNNRVLIWNALPEDHNVPADLVLGQRDFTGDQPNRGSDRASADSLHWPSALLVVGQSLIVADTGNRRLLIWDRLPSEHAQPADHVLGQPDFTSRSDNGGEPSAGSFRWPHALTLFGADLVVADAGNSRLLVFDGVPRERGALAYAIIGQGDAQAVDHNRGAYWPTPRSLNMPYGAVTAADSGGQLLVVADTASSRLLGFTTVTGDPTATRLSGQLSFEDKGDNRWSMAARDSVCWPYAVSIYERTLVIADSGNNRVLLWDLADVGVSNQAEVSP